MPNLSAVGVSAIHAREDVNLTVMDVASTLEDERDFGVEGEQVKIVKFYGGSTPNLT